MNWCVIKKFLWVVEEMDRCTGTAQPLLHCVCGLLRWGVVTPRLSVRVRCGKDNNGFIWIGIKKGGHCMYNLSL